MTLDFLVLLTLIVALLALDVGAVRFRADSRASRTMDSSRRKRHDL